MIAQVGDEMRPPDLVLRSFRPLPVDELEEIEAERHALHSDERRDVLDVIDVTIERGVVFSRTNENGVHPDDTTPSADRFNLSIADVPLNIVIPPRVRV